MATATLKAKLTLNDSLFQAGIKRASAAVYNFAKVAASVGFKTLGTGVALASAAMVAGSRRIIDLGDDLLRMKRITGISVESLFILREAFEQSGTSAESIGPTIGRMQKNLFGASKSGLSSTIQSMGIDMQKLLQMRPDEQFLLLGKAIDKLPDLQKQAAAMEVFGKAGLGILPVFAELKDFDSKGLEQQAKFMGKNAEAFDNANDAIRRMKTLSSGLFGGMAVMIAPLLERLAKAFAGVDWIAAGNRISKAVSNIVKTGMGLLAHPELVWDAFVDAAKFAMPMIGRMLAEAFVFAIKAFAQLIGKVIVIAGEMMIAVALGMGGAMINGFMNAVAYLHAGIMYAATNFVATITQGVQQVLAAMGVNVGATKGTTWKEQIKKSKNTFANGNIGERGMDAGTAMMATAMKDLKTIFQGGGIAKAMKFGNDTVDIGPSKPITEKEKQWRLKSNFTPQLKGASMAGGLSHPIFSAGRDPVGSYSSLKGASLIDGAGAAQGGKALRSSGMIFSREKRRQEARERNNADKGIDLSNSLLTKINMKLENFGE